jgi:hypothetical protein
LNPLALLAGELAVDLAVELAVEPHGPSPSETRWLSLLCVASNDRYNTPSHRCMRFACYTDNMLLPPPLP